MGRDAVNAAYAFSNDDARSYDSADAARDAWTCYAVADARWIDAGGGEGDGNGNAHSRALGIDDSGAVASL